jgi:outer membrane receptor protein involved in Fe transport
MGCKGRFLLFLLLVSVAQFLPRNVQAQGQSVYGAITGVVTDPSGAAIPKAKVTATNMATGVSTATESDSAGYYVVGNLTAGTYTLEVSVTGFQGFKEQNIVVDIDRTVRIDPKMVVGNVTQTVEVTGAAPALQTEKVEVTGTITSTQLDSIPTAYNNATGFVKLMPGVLEAPGGQGLPGNNGTDGYFGVSANGARSQQNFQMLDGTIDTEPIGGAAGVVPPIDALEAVTATTANYDVEYGQAQGVVTSLTTKSGSNKWHGTGYEFNQVNATSARNPFTEATSNTGHFVWNQFGGTIGGPIKKNKAFVFGGFQGTRVRSGANTLTSVPVAAFRNGDFSAIAATNPIYDPTTGNPDGSGRTQFAYGGTPNVMNPANFSPVSVNLLKLIPLPNSGTGYQNNFVAPLGSYTGQNTQYERVDYNLNENNRLFGRYTHNWGHGGCTNVSGFGPGAAPALALPDCALTTGSEDFITVDFVHVFTPTFVVEARFGDMIYRTNEKELDQSASTSTSIGLVGLNDACSVCGGLAGFNVGGPVGNFDVGNTSHNYQVDDEGNYDYVGIATWTKGSHTVKFGSEIDLANDHRRDTASQGEFGCANTGVCNGNGFPQSITGDNGVNGSGLGMAAFLLGDAGAFGRVIYANPLPAANQKRDAFYIQDTWHVTKKFTAILGLRYDYIGYPTSPFKGGIANFNFTNSDSIVSNFTGVSATGNVNENWKNFAPRVGLAYQVMSGTVVRAGYAKAYPIGFYGANFGAITNDWPNASREDLSQTNPYFPLIQFPQQTLPPFVSGFSILAAAGNPGQYPTPPDSEGFGQDPHNPTNSVDQWNFTIEHDFGNRTTLSAAYVGSATRHLFYRIDYNASKPGPGLNIEDNEAYFPAYGYYSPAYNQSNQSTSGYEGLQINFVKRYSQGFTLTTALTWSKAYDEGTHNPFDPFDSKLDRAPEDGERALILSIGHVWELPFGKGKPYLSNSSSVVNALVSGWKWSGITRYMSGDPLTPVWGDQSSLNSNCCTLRPDRIAGGFVSNPTASRWFNTAAFIQPGLYREGTAGRGILRGPGFFDADWSLARDFKLGETTKFSIQWQLLNAFNRANLSDPDTTVTDSTAAQIFGIAQGMRTMQLGIHFYF